MDLRFTITVDGTVVSDKIAIRSVDTCNGANRIAELTLVLEDGDLAKETYETADAELFKMGKAIEVKAGFGDGEQVTIFNGVITAQGIGYELQPFMSVTARGEAIKLAQSRLSKLYEAQTADSDIIKDLLSTFGVTAGEVAESKIKHQQFLVVEQSPWRVLMQRATANGFVFVSDEKNHLIDIGQHQPTAHKFNVAMDGCVDFNLQADISSHLKKSQTTTWDIKEQKLADNADAAAAPASLRKHTEADDALALPDVLSYIQAPVATEELVARASAEQNYRLLDMYQGRVRVDMSAKNAPVKAKLLDTLELSGIGKQYAGEYVISEVRHSLSTQGWFCEFVLGLPLTLSAWHADAQLQPLPTLVGTVAAFQEDPEALHRIPVLLPTASDNQPVWARLLSPFVGNETGLFLPPDPDTEVMIGFIAGDGRYPVILGACHNPKMVPPFPYDDKNEVRGLFFKEQAMAMQFSLKEPQLVLQGSEEQTMTFGKDVGLALTQKDMVTVTAKDTLVIESKDKAKLEMSKDIAMKAGNIELSGDGVEVK